MWAILDYFVSGLGLPVVSSEINIEWKYLKSIVTRKIYYFELGTFSHNSYVYNWARGFTDSTRAFDLLARAFNLAALTFGLLSCEFELVTRAFELATRGFELVTRRFEPITRGLEHVTSNS